MTNCKKCFNAVARIPLRYPPKKQHLLWGQIMYSQAKIRCKMGWWVKDSDGKEKVYENLVRFVNTVRIGNKIRGCPDYET